MIDLHCHVLPGFDDGPDDWPLALKMCAAAYRDGVGGVVATPHFFREIFDTPTVANVHAAVTRLQQRCDEVFESPFQLYMGADCHLHADIIENVQAGRVPTINGSRYILLELPDRAIPPHTSDLLFSISMNGLTPIITHPERNRVLQRHPELLCDFIEGGALAQGTAQSLTGHFGERAQDAAALMLTHNLIQVIASDGHDVERRPPELSSGREAAAELVGEEQARRMVDDVPRAILNDEPVNFAPPLHPERKARRRGILRTLLGG